MARSHIYVRPLDVNRQEDIAAAQKAMESSGRYFPQDAFRLPSTQIMLAEKEGEIVLVQPFYRSLVMGSVAQTGKATETEVASAMHQMTAAAYTDAHRFGLLNVLAFSNTPETRHFATRHGFMVPEHPPLVMEVR